MLGTGGFASRHGSGSLQQLPNALSSAYLARDRIGGTRPCISVVNWHEACVRPGAFKGTETAALPTLAAERRVIDAFQT
jgi:hypothetical protein